MNLIHAFVRNVGTHGLMIREYIKREDPQDKSTDAAMGADWVVVVKKFL
jgi:hypothetical protein